MTIRVGINGFGRIGRNFYRALLASGADIEVVAFNDLFDDDTQAQLLKYDSILGRLDVPVEVVEGGIKVGDKIVKSYAERDPAALPWGDIGADVVIESTGFFTDATKAKAHLDAGAKKVIISAPAKNEDWTVVMGVNDDEYDPAKHNIISNASCTTNCLAPMAKALDDGLGIVKGLMTTIHAYTQDQNLQDGPHRIRAGPVPQRSTSCRPPRARRRRSAWCSRSSRASWTARRCGSRCPTGSATDLSFEASRETSVEEVNGIMQAAADGPLKGYLKYTSDPIVSTDIVTDPSSCIFDSGLTKVIGNQVKVVGWYDNEWGYSNRLIDLVAFIGESL